MNIAIGADHRGFLYKERIKKYITHMQQGEPIVWLDVGSYTDERSDYPLFAQKVCAAIVHGQAQRGILICASGIGMAVTANRFCGIYAGIAWNVESARVGREDDNTNVLVIPSNFVTQEDMIAIVNVWLAAQFKEGRYRSRIAMIDAVIKE